MCDLENELFEEKLRATFTACYSCGEKHKQYKLAKFVSEMTSFQK